MTWGKKIRIFLFSLPLLLSYVATGAENDFYLRVSIALTSGKAPYVVGAGLQALPPHTELLNGFTGTMNVGMSEMNVLVLNKSGEVIERGLIRHSYGSATLADSPSQGKSAAAEIRNLDIPTSRRAYRLQIAEGKKTVFDETLVEVVAGDLSRGIQKWNFYSQLPGIRELKNRKTSGEADSQAYLKAAAKIFKDCPEPANDLNGVCAKEAKLIKLVL